MGFAHLTPNGGTHATVLMDPVEELAQEQQLVSKAQILGHAVAHEIGHLVMGLNSHSPRGLMRAGWKANDLRDMAERHLLFSRREGERMRIRIAMYYDAVQSPRVHDHRNHKLVCHTDVTNTSTTVDAEPLTSQKVPRTFGIHTQGETKMNSILKTQNVAANSGDVLNLRLRGPIIDTGTV